MRYLLIDKFPPKSHLGRKTRNDNFLKYDRRRGGHPAIGKPAYTAAELEFLFAVDQWTATHSRRPAWNDLQRIMRSLGYLNTSGAPSGAGEAAYDQAIETWRTRTGRRFPTWTEVFSVIEGLGFRRHDQEAPETIVILPTRRTHRRRASR